ncbi:hypothetical protein PVK06_019148 [Gossypium arboreum]|uniref:RNase H type-1 domain-containing protein n=1 Tax=Gossypium arboreum TaxID=29729 RepID=A0ABR0PIU1_GOSAR|nr:hypothetical protein PVK06_019148 [Gossypium arboreum]
MVFREKGIGCLQFWVSSRLILTLPFKEILESTIAVLARDSRSGIRGAETYLIEDVANVFIAEARACERSLLFARMMGFRFLVVEGDSLTVIKKLQPIPWQRKGEEVKDLGFGLMEFRLQ